MVMNDQLKVLEDFDQFVTGKEQSLAYSQIKVLQGHLNRIQQMDKLAEKTIQSVRTRLAFTRYSNNISLIVFST